MLTDILYNHHGIRLPKLLKRKCAEAKKMNIKPNEGGINGKKFLTIIACHSINTQKVKVVINNIKKLEFSGNKIVIVSSVDTRYDYQLREIAGKMYPNVEMFSIPNDSASDVGKWMYYIKNEYVPNYDHVVFTNDSIYLNYPIYHWYKFMERSNVELYGYNDSSQEDKYHYQSFLYSVKKSSIPKLVNYYDKVKPLLTGYNEIIDNFEKKLVDIFERIDCFLPIAYIQGNRGKNIYFNNDSLYQSLVSSGGMSIVKLKRVSGTSWYQPHIPQISQKIPLVSGFLNYGASLPNQDKML